jgi:two-component system cell cycle sensor histidine kinase/response regulator CckA
VGTTPFPLTHADDIERLVDLFLEALQHHQPIRTGPYRAQHRDGSWRWLTSTGIAYPSSDEQVRYLSVTRDITEERRLEEERRQLEEHLQWTQKLESLGVMAGGIAHDFNNLLTPILGDATLALMDLPAGSPSRTRLERIQKAAQRAAALTTQMLAYSGERPLVSDPIDLSSLVRDTAALFESAVAGRASINFNLSKTLPTVDGDAGQLTQVALNLCTNAAEAVAEGHGSLIVRTGALELENDLSLLGETLEAGCYALLEVADNGAGMDEATRSRIFDPFYSTKFTGRGLGLASTLGIVRGHGGSIEVDSELGRGTRIRVLLPASKRTSETVENPRSHSRTCSTSGTILIVDDDEGVRELTAETLRRAGFDVLCAVDGREGIEVFRERADEIRAVLLDRTMPVTGGEEAFAEMRAIRKDARIILVSGYSKERAQKHFSSGDLAGFLQKPFLPAALLDLLRSVLDD